jgi:hypothetical protein
MMPKVRYSAKLLNILVFCRCIKTQSPKFVVLVMADILTRFAQEIERYVKTSVMIG